MMMETSEIVLYAMWRQAEKEGRHLIVNAEEVAYAMADIDLYERHVHLTRSGATELRVQFS